MSDLRLAMGRSAAGMQVQAKRISIVTQNIANAETTGLTPGSLPYRRQVIYFGDYMDKGLGGEVVKVKQVSYDPSPFKMKYDPHNPAADKNGYVLMPNVDRIIEAKDLEEASQSYEANLNALDISKSMLFKTIDMLK